MKAQQRSDPRKFPKVRNRIGTPQNNFKQVIFRIQIRKHPLRVDCMIDAEREEGRKKQARKERAGKRKKTQNRKRNRIPPADDTFRVRKQTGNTRTKGNSIRCMGLASFRKPNDD